MTCKKFFAKDMGSAISQIKQELGTNAVILSNKTTQQGIEVIAKNEEQIQETQNVKEDKVTLSSKQLKSPINSSKTKANLNISKQEKEKLISILNKSSNIKESFNEKLSKVNKSNIKTVNRTIESNIHTLEDKIKRLEKFNDSKSKLALKGLFSEVLHLRKLLENQVSGLMWQEVQRAEPIRAMLINQLKGIGFSKQISFDLTTKIDSNINCNLAKDKVIKTLLNQILVDNGGILKKGGIVSLVGPTGVGKTTTIAKLAAHFATKYGKEQVALISTDTFRIGAKEQLEIYGKIIGCKTRTIDSKNNLFDIIKQCRKCKLILIDTAGMSQRDIKLNAQLDSIANMQNSPIRNYLVLSATSQRQILQETINYFKHIPICATIITKLDEALSLGAILSVTIANNLPIGYLTDGQNVPGDIMLGDAGYLVEQATSFLKDTQKIKEDQKADTQELETV